MSGAITGTIMVAVVLYVIYEMLPIQIKAKICGTTVEQMMKDKALVAEAKRKAEADAKKKVK